MADWPLASGFRAETFGTVTGNPAGTTVTSNATANTKGSWIQLDASTAFDSTALLLAIDLQYSDTLYLFDIGVGASGSEQVLIPNLLVVASAGISTQLLLPIGIPAGSRIAARAQDNFGGSPGYLSGTLFARGFYNTSPLQNFTAYGPNTTTSGGVSVDPGATANTKSAWVQLTASTTSVHKALMLSAIRPNPGTLVTANYAQLIDIGVGASGSEQVLAQNLRMECSTQTGGVATPYTPGSGTLSGFAALQPGYIPPIFCDIPAGSRLAVRHSSSSVQATDRTSAYAIYGLS